MQCDNIATATHSHLHFDASLLFRRTLAGRGMVDPGPMEDHAPPELNSRATSAQAEVPIVLERTRPGLRTAPLFMLLASAVFTVMIALVKVARQELSGLEVVLWRGLLSAPLLAFSLRRVGTRIHNPGAFAGRLVFGFAAMVCLATAARGLSLVDMSLIAKLRPILIALAAPLVLGRSERVGRGVWAVLVLGFAGTAVLLGPQLAVGSLWGAWVLASVLFGVGAHLCLRRLGATDNARAIVFWFHLGIAGLALPMILITQGGLRLPSSGMWPVLAGVALTATVAQLLITRAFALDRAPVVAAASYSGPVWSLLGDLFVFGLVPPLTSLIGGALVLCPSLWLVVRREGGRR